jgi:enediyne biosynthesis protein E4
MKFRRSCTGIEYSAILVTLVFTLISVSCQKDSTLFERLSSRKTHISFKNTLTETDTFNYFLFPYMYMGGGVSVADFNHDGLTDIYFTGNMTSNRLYLNKGNFRFEDVTDISKTGGTNRNWKLGTTVCDVNNDGWPDLYVSVSGLNGNCRNLLFVNHGNNAQGIPVFSEEAAAYGIDDNGKSTQGTFFDYDNDGDLDLYVANYPITQFKSPPYFYRQMMNHASLAESGHLYRNNGNGTFTNVTAEAGLLTFGLSLSATVSDLNQDGYKDLYISNDFTSPDFYFINNGNGTFTDRTGEVTGQTSFYGMGADIADYNNDGLPDVMQIDMAPEDNQRAKENMTTMHADDFAEMVKEGLHYQYRYSTLQLNRGNMQNGLPFFSNAAWIAGVTSTDWSWAALFADFNLDGWKDLYVTNGSRRDINNIDFFDRMQKGNYFASSPGNTDFLQLIKEMPAQPLVNYIFRNNSDLTFTHCSKEWGLKEKSYSNGCAYADLDNDGDLELIVNNIDQEALIYKNNARELGMGNYLKISFKGPLQNLMGIGSEVTVYTGGKMQVAELTLSRGYESSVEPMLYFGTGPAEIVDSLVARWPDGKKQVLKNVKTNQNLALSYKQASMSPAVAGKPAMSPADGGRGWKLFTDITSTEKIDFLHVENDFNDYSVQPLLPHKLSTTGPCVAVGDINNDGREDFFAGNALHAKGALYVQEKDGSFRLLHGPWEADSDFEDTGALFFDADNDGDQDLYVVSGGNEFPDSSSEYCDRLYLNSGKEVFVKDVYAIPAIASSGSCVIPVDFDRDGDQDLFVGGRHVPGRYPFPASGYILENRPGKGTVQFVNVTDSVAPFLKNAGMITSALRTDIDKDGWDDLVIAGEWMPVTILKNRNGKFESNVIPGTNGWWFSLASADFDKDGDVDLVAGNLGLNTRYRATTEKTFDVYAGDFDKDGRIDIDLAFYQGNHQYPLRSRSCYLLQHPGFAERFPTYESFAKAEMNDLYPKDILKSGIHLKVETFASCYLENLGNGKFSMKDLPSEAQLSAINGIVAEDFDNDGMTDILAAGNLFDTEITTPRNDAGAGIFLKGDGKGNFVSIPPSQSGFLANKDVKAMALIHLVNDKTGKAVLVGNNNERLQIFNVK